MQDRIDKDHPVIQKEIHAHVDQALRSRGVDYSDPIKGKLLSRVEVLFGHHDQPVIRFRGPDQTLMRAEACLDSMLNAPEQSSNMLAGAARILWSDKEAVLHADPARISRGELVIYDDRTHPR
jgi:hypothetical protein